MAEALAGACFWLSLHLFRVMWSPLSFVWACLGVYVAGIAVEAYAGWSSGAQRPPFGLNPRAALAGSIVAGVVMAVGGAVAMDALGLSLGGW